MEKKAKDKNILSTLIEKYMKLNISIKIISALVIVILILVFIIMNDESRRISISAKSSLEEIKEVANLETVEYSYTTIAKKCIKKECKNNDINDYEYFVKYTGVVTAGIDFQRIKVEVKDYDKKIIITIPDAELLSYKVETDVNDLEFMFKSKKNNEPAKLAEIYEACLEDFENKTKKDKLILDTAKKNSIEIIKSFMEPWKNTNYADYELEVK